jgi:ribosomal protein L12E/L44/L45/RPP1/RPP2
MLDPKSHYLETTTVDTDDASIKLLVLMICSKDTDEVIGEADIAGGNILYLN